MGNENETQPIGTTTTFGAMTIRRVLTARQRKFRESVLQSNLSLLIDCLGLGVNPNLEILDGNCALHIAAEKCDYPMLQILLSRSNIDYNMKNGSGFTPLMVACIVNCREVVQMFLKKQADPNIKTPKEHTALHFACENRSMGIVFDLIANGAIVDSSNIFDVTPLSISVIDRPSMAIAKFLLRKECVLACNSPERLNMVKVLVHNGMDRHQVHPLENRNCLHYVAISGYQPLAEYLVTLNTEPDLFVRDATGRTPMDLCLDHHTYIIFHLFKFAFLKKKIEEAPQRQTVRRHRTRSERKEKE